MNIKTENALAFAREELARVRAELERIPNLESREFRVRPVGERIRIKKKFATMREYETGLLNRIAILEDMQE